MAGWEMPRKSIGICYKHLNSSVIIICMKYLGGLWLMGQVVWGLRILVQRRARDQQADPSYMVTIEY